MSDPDPPPPPADASATKSFDAAPPGNAGDPTLSQQPAHRQSPLTGRIGNYSIKRVIASGGMGTVYLAQQEQPRRTVALKVMKSGLASKSALRRFEYESQILARLRHPHIAQVFESGTHDDGSGGVPYFAMEYIPNACPITEYARNKKLTVRERLELFAKVCDAVNHGHQKGIIHRDLKPANILVDAEGEPKIIDFGVARATDSDMAVTTLQTDIGQLIGTLQYMSPEQCDADPHDLDTRSDVYALGVLLFELLTAHLPYDVSGIVLHEATRVIREQPPARPTAFDRSLRGDIETIVLTALEKDRQRRYKSAEALGNDIARYLTFEPILARRASLVYLMSRFMVRRKRIVLTLMAIAGMLLGLVSYQTREFQAYGLTAFAQLCGMLPPQDEGSWEPGDWTWQPDRQRLELLLEADLVPYTVEDREHFLDAGNEVNAATSSWVYLYIITPAERHATLFFATSLLAALLLLWSVIGLFNGTPIAIGGLIITAPVHVAIDLAFICSLVPAEYEGWRLPYVLILTAVLVSLAVSVFGFLMIAHPQRLISAFSEIVLILAMQVFNALAAGVLFYLYRNEIMLWMVNMQWKWMTIS